MQALQITLQKIRAYLGELTPTAKMLIGALMIILIMALFLVNLYAGRTEMASIGLSGSMSSEARGEAVRYLESRNIPYKIQGNDVLVPEARKYVVLADLADDQVINTSQIDFDTLVAEDSPFLSKKQQDMRWLTAKMNVISATISNMSGIKSARVVIDDPQNASGIGRAHIPPTASVNVEPETDGLNQQQVDAIAEMVAGSHVGLKKENVRVIDARAGRAMSPSSDDAIATGENLRLQMKQEQLVQDKIQRLLDFVPGVNVEVNIAVDTRRELSRIDSYQDPKVGTLEERSRTIQSENTQRGGVGGVQPNTGASVPGRSRGSQMTDEQTEARLANRFPREERQIKDNKGYALKINAAVGIPKSYFVRLFREQQQDDQAAPTPQQLDAIVQSETERIRNYVEPLVDTGPLEDAVTGTIAVSMIPDFALAALPGGGGAESGAAGGSSGGGIAGNLLGDGWLQTATLALLALVSVAMMIMLVRRATVQEELPSAEELVGVPPALSAAQSDIVGEADESAPPMEGLEVDDDELRREQLLEQVNALAKEAPDAAANLIRKWIRAD